MISKKHILLALLFFPGVVNAKYYVKDSVSLLLGADTNPLFAQTATTGMDMFIRTDPQLDFIMDKRDIYIRIGGGLDYNKYFDNTNQSYVAFKFDGELDLKPDEQTRVIFSNSYSNNSDPTVIGTESRSKWTLYNIRANVEHDTVSNEWSFISGLEVDSKKYDDSSYSNFDNRKAYINMEARYFFFPETSLVFGAKGGRSFYTAGYDARPYGNSDSVHIEGFFGLKGRFIADITMDLRAGFLWLNYENGSDFHEQFMTLKVTDVFSDNASLTAAYERTAYDSVYSNFYVDQKVLSEFKSVWYDSMINLATFQYTYRYYRMYPRRVDHILGFITELAVPIIIIGSINENIAFTTKFMAEWINSDAYNSFGLYNGPDPSASYRRLVLMVGLTNKF